MRRVTVHGPYKHGKKFRVHFVTGSGDARTTAYETFATRTAAQACIDGARDEAQGTTVGQAIEMFLDAKRVAGVLPGTVDAYDAWLLTLLEPILTRPVRAAATRGEELYRATQGDRRADTHRNFLGAGRRWGKWCVKAGLLKENPFADIDPAGRRTLGSDKSRLTVDESVALDAWCRAHPSDPAAVLALAYLLLGSRASELTKRDVRDLDDNGRLLWIRRAKTPSGSRRLAVPEELSVLMLRLTAGRPGDAPIFVDANGNRMSRHVARLRVRSVCVAAGVPALSPQALRRTQSTLATGAGETGLAVARQLGHSTGAAPAVTHRSYIDRDSAAAAQGERALQLIQGGRR